MCRWGFEVKTIRTGRILKQYRVGKYLGIRFTMGEVNVYTHRLVAAAFLSKRLDQDQINHKNGDKHDNRAENLEWATQSENMLHSTHVLGNKIGQFGPKRERIKAVEWPIQP
jgi:HNH endonuclease